MSEYKHFELNDEQLAKFVKIHRNQYGSSGAFLGMCSNQASELNLPFEEVLRANLDYAIQADLTDEWEKEKNKKEVEEKPVKKVVRSFD